jgi:hypothetical protein
MKEASPAVSGAWRGHKIFSRSCSARTGTHSLLLLSRVRKNLAEEDIHKWLRVFSACVLVFMTFGPAWEFC